MKLARELAKILEENSSEISFEEIITSFFTDKEGEFKEYFFRNEKIEESFDLWCGCTGTVDLKFVDGRWFVSDAEINDECSTHAGDANDLRRVISDISEKLWQTDANAIWNPEYRELFSLVRN